MAYTRKRRYASKNRSYSSSRSFSRYRRAAPSRRRSAPKRARTQTIRIVVENPQVNQAILPTMLPEQVGRVIATTPRRARF